MREISGRELVAIDPIIEAARQAAMTSTCQRDHRGAVVFRDNQILGVAANGPLPPLECKLEVCGNVCGIFAMHAERLSIIHALNAQVDLTGASVLHVRIEDDEVQVSGALRCEDCTGYMTRVGRNKRKMVLNEFILLQEGGWTAYGIDEADKISRRNLGLSE